MVHPDASCKARVVSTPVSPSGRDSGAGEVRRLHKDCATRPREACRSTPRSTTLNRCNLTSEHLTNTLSMPTSGLRHANSRDAWCGATPTGHSVKPRCPVERPAPADADRNPPPDRRDSPAVSPCVAVSLPCCSCWMTTRVPCPFRRASQRLQHQHPAALHSVVPALSHCPALERPALRPCPALERPALQLFRFSGDGGSAA